MATIENKGPTTAWNFNAVLRKMPAPVLLAQQCTQQGAVHAIAYLLKIGANEENAAATLASLRLNMDLVREEAARRGLQELFPEDQTGFN